MNNKDFIASLTRKSGRTQTETQHLVSEVITAMSQELENGNSVLVGNFGTFEVKKRLEREIVNPVSHQRMLVPPKLVLNFRPVAAVKNRLKKGGEK